MFVSTEIALNMLHIDEIGSLSGVSDTSSCAWSSELDYKTFMAYFYMFNPDSTPDLRPELIRLITFWLFISFADVS